MYIIYVSYICIYKTYTHRYNLHIFQPFFCYSLVETTLIFHLHHFTNSVTCPCASALALVKSGINIAAKVIPYKVIQVLPFLYSKPFFIVPGLPEKF